MADLENGMLKDEFWPDYDRRDRDAEWDRADDEYAEYAANRAMIREHKEYLQQQIEDARRWLEEVRAWPNF